MDIYEFHSVCLVNGIILDDEQIKIFERYHRELVYWNEKINLISKNDIDHIYLRHFLHSLSILKYIYIPQKSFCLDIGTGAGFPGLPIKIARTDLKMTLIDSIKKKAKITEMFALHTGLKYIEVLSKRVEELKKDMDYKNKFDFIFARAVSTVKNLIFWSLPLIKDQGKIVLLKGGDLQKELKEISKLIKNLEVEEIQIDLLNCDWFKNEEKKILICYLA